MEKNEERKNMTRRTEEEMNWEEYLAKIHAEAEAEIEQEEREEKELWGQDQSGLKGLHICRRIARETQAEMIENLSI